ncbi:hypothetical protein FE257_007083 [Aspergillus nanangensis]|uniref:Major facilitator superfamily (MFS) profile domain-containing protein n=1 Tax=Aspergillus nanangensis TaxID=2582783 RepID=A0AAD4CN45_ASPNN|nr:hypothetical protein FE257_007083 [Aspergillus nanangensis]
MASLSSRGPGQESSLKGPPNPPRLLKLRSSPVFIVFVVVFAVFTDIFLYGLIVPVAPTALRERVGIPEADVQRWTSILIALYGATLLAASPIAGYLADRIESRWWPLMIGLLSLGAATALLCVGTTLGLWIAGRLFQGASAAVVWSVGCALVVDTVDIEHLGQSLGYIGLGMTFGIVAGPLLGGVLYDYGGYYAVFGLAFGFVAMDIVFRLIMIERKDAIKWLPSQPPTPREIPERKVSPQNSVPQLPQLNLTVSSIRCPSPAVSGDRLAALSPLAAPSPSAEDEEVHRDTNPHGLTRPETATKERKKQRPIWILLGSRRMIVALWAYFVSSMILTAFDTVLPLFVHDTFGWEQTGQGLIFLPIAVPHLFDPLVGYINDRFVKARRFLASGGLLFLLPILVALRFVSDNSISQKVLLCALLVLVGVCLSMFIPPALTEISYIVQKKEEKHPDAFGTRGATALAYGIMNAAFAAGSLVAPFFAGFIRATAGWNTMSWALALLPGVSSIPVLLWLGGSIFEKKNPDDAVDQPGQSENA